MSLQRIKAIDIVENTTSEQIAGIESHFISLVSLSINMLVLRMTKLLRPVGDLLQILGLIAQAGRLDVFHLIPESTWRILWLGCRKCGGHLMRRVSNVIFEVLQIAGIELDAISAGQYVQAMTKTNSSICTDYSGGVLDGHLYLEEIGYLWYIHQMAILGVGGQREVISQSLSKSKSLLTPERGLERRRSLRGLSKLSFESPEFVATSMQLGKKSGLLSLLCPSRSVYHAALPTAYFVNETELKARYSDLNDRLEDILFEAGPREETAKAPPLTRASDLQVKQSSWNWGWGSPKPAIATNLSEDFDIARGSVETHTHDSNSSGNLSKPTFDLPMLQNFLSDCLESLGETKGMVTCISSRTPCGHCGFAPLDEETVSAWLQKLSNDSEDMGRLRTLADHVDFHRLVCARCGSNGSPQLHIRYYSKSEPLPSPQAFASSSSKPCIPGTANDVHAFRTTLRWSKSVPYLCPLSVFRLYELLVFYEGEMAIEKSWLCSHHPELYWNLLWYGSRLGFPLALVESHGLDPSNIDPISGHTLLDGPVIATWRELTAEQMAIRALWNVGAPQVVLSDLLPKDSAEQPLRAYVDIAGDLHDSVDGMKRGIIALYSEVEFNKLLVSADDSPARLLYAVLLILYYLYYGEVLKERDSVVYEDVQEVFSCISSIHLLTNYRISNLRSCICGRLRL